MKEEMVLVVRRSLLESLGMFQGLQFDIDRYLIPMLSRENNFFAARSSAETDPSLKQIIPYAILTSGGKVLRYKRGKKSGEQRLVAKGSIGIGGHMNDRDEGLFALDKEAYFAGVQREIDEELIVEPPLENRIAALINDDSNEVGQVHLGVGTGAPDRRETRKHDPQYRILDAGRTSGRARHPRNLVPDLRRPPGKTPWEVVSCQWSVASGRAYKLVGSSMGSLFARVVHGDSIEISAD
jgi:predicted NUDIX family phosphoesterase